MIILEGPQGKGKSSLLRMLFGAQWFTDHLPDLTQKDSLLQLLGMWCIEVAELATLGRSDAGKIKAFLTSRTDRYRPPYGKVAKDFPRSCVFAGTVNPGAAGYLKDPTGGRRFWPVAINGMIDTAAIAAQRDQMWAEADARYKSGEPWWLDASTEAEAREAQEMRREDDAWEDLVATYLLGKTQTSISEVLEHAIGLTQASDWKQVDENRVRRIMSAFGWKRRNRRINRKQKWVYIKEDSEI